MTPTKASPSRSLLTENTIGKDRFASPVSFDNGPMTFHDDEIN